MYERQPVFRLEWTGVFNRHGGLVFDPKDFSWTRALIDLEVRRRVEKDHGRKNLNGLFKHLK
jgi:hypothetical protein